VAKRTEVYKSYTVSVELGDIVAIMGSQPGDEVLGLLAAEIQRSYGRQFIGYCYDEQAEKLLLTLRTQAAATELAETWQAVVNTFVQDWERPWNEQEGQ